MTATDIICDPPDGLVALEARRAWGDETTSVWSVPPDVQELIDGFVVWIVDEPDAAVADSIRRHAYELELIAPELVIAKIELESAQQHAHQSAIDYHAADARWKRRMVERHGREWLVDPNGGLRDS